MTSVHIINRLPTAALLYKTPYQLLFNKPAPYDHLKVFGCLAIVSNPETHTHKFSARGIPCVFLGYPPNKKGYYFLNLVTKEAFVSRDAMFYEHIFTLNVTTPKPYLHPTPMTMPYVNSSSACDDEFVQSLNETVPLTTTESSTTS